MNYGLPGIAAPIGVGNLRYRPAGINARTRMAEAKLRESISVLDFIPPDLHSAIRDGTLTADLAPYIQAAIDMVKGRGDAGLAIGSVYLPAGSYRIGTGLVIDRAVRIIGDGSAATRIKTLPGFSAPAVTIRTAHDGNNYTAQGQPEPVVSLIGLRLTGNKDDPAGQANGHGLSAATAATNPVRPWIWLDDVVISEFPADGINSVDLQGVIVGRDCIFYNNKRDNVSATRANDWQFTNCAFGVANRDNLLLSECGQCVFVACNFFSAERYNANLFANWPSVNHLFYGCSFDRAKQHGIFYDVRGGGVVGFYGCYWQLNSQSAPGTYSDIWVDANVTTGLKLVGGWFDAIGQAKNNIEFANAASRVAVDDVAFASGNIRTTGVTNNRGSIETIGAGIVQSAASGATVFAGQQFTGFALRTDAGTPVADMTGQLSGNAGGLIRVFNASGTMGAQLAAPGTGQLTLLNIPGPYANDTAAASAGVPVGYAYRNNSNAVVVRAS